MHRSDVEPVFRTKRQKLLRDTLVALLATAVLRAVFLGDVGLDVPDGIPFAGGAVVGGFGVASYARGVRWPDGRLCDLLASLLIVLPLSAALRAAETATVLACVGLLAGGLATRLGLYATGGWRPGDPP